MALSLWFFPAGSDDRNARERNDARGGDRQRHTDAHESIENHDAASVAALRAGNRSVFDALYLQHFRPLWALAFRYLGSRDAAEDAVQDVFVSLWERRAELDVRESLATYLYAAVKRRALTMLRNRGSVTRITERQAPLDVAGIGTTASRPDMEHDEATLDDVVARLLAPFSPRTREILLLRWKEELTHQEIAHRLGISVSAVKMQTLRASARLREALDRLFRA